MLEFRILGPLEVLHDDRTIELGGARQRAVLAILLLHRGETVSVDRIVDLLWGGRPPPTAVKTVQVYVSHLRRALVDDVIVSSRGGYSLVVDADSVDVLRFERLVDEGRAAGDPRQAAELLRAGLALWRGPALGDLSYERFAQDEAARLEELRVAAIEERVEADLSLGRHAALVPELELLVREHPLRERLRGQHMLALYRSGRQADALDSFLQARRSLVEELGLEPGRDLRELERAILAQDPALDPPRARGRPAKPVARRRRLALIAAGLALAVIAATVGVAGALHRSRAAVAVLPDSVAVIDPASGLVVADVPVGARPEAVAADARFVWVANAADGTVQQIDLRERRVVATITPGIGVDALAVGAGSAWIADGGNGRAVRLDADLGAVADSVALQTTRETGLRSRTTAAALGGGALWVTSTPLAAVLRVDTATKRVSSRVSVGNEPAGVAIGAGAVWVADGTDNTVSRIVPAGAGAVTDTIPLGNGPGPIAVGDSGVWVANRRDGTVSRIDPVTRSVKAVVPVGELPSGVAVGGGAVWVANSLSGTVSRIDPRTNRVTQTVELGGAPHALTIAGGRLWVTVEDAAPRPAPAGGRSIARVLLSDDLGTSDPTGLLDPPLAWAICARLETYASPGGSGAGHLVPELAATPPAVSGGGRVYTFRVRTGYRFSPPSGRPVTAAAFQRAIERALNRGTNSSGAEFAADIVGAAAYRAGRARTVAGVSARGDRLTIRLTRPSRTLPARMAMFYFCAVPPDTPIRPRGLDRVATAGPYYIAEVAPRVRLVLRRNPGYPGPRPRRLEAIEVTIGTPPDRAVAEVEAGRADYVPNVPLAAQARLVARYGPDSRAAASGRQRYFTGPQPLVRGVLFNPHRPLFARAAMRRAVNYAIDRRAWARVLGGRPTDQHLPPGWPGFRDATIYPLGGPDLVTARRLAGSGHRRGVMYACNFPDCRERAEIVRENLAAIGIELEIRQFSSGEMFARVRTPGEPFDLSLFAWGGDLPDPSEFIDALLAYYTPTGFLKPTRLGRQVRAASTRTDAARTKAYAALDREIAAQAAPFAPAVSGENADFFAARIGCQTEHPLYGIDLAALCLRR